MKKSLYIISILFLAEFSFSCASTLQNDVYISRDYNSKVMESIYEYEKDFIQYDSSNLTGNDVISQELYSFEKTLINQLKNQHLEPVVKARLNAFLGLTSLIKNDRKSASNYYANGKKNEAGDEYVILLGIRLEKDSEKQFETTNTYLSKDNNPLILLEKAILLYNCGSFDQAVGAIDSALLLFDDQNRVEYRTAYTPFRNLIWELYNSNISDISTAAVISKTKTLNCETMVQLTMDNSTLLDDFTSKTKINSKEMVKTLKNYGVFNAAQDLENNSGSAEDLLNSKELSKIQCARFIWNLYVLKKGKKNLVNRYSNRYLQMNNTNPVSPINDVPVTDLDFDAVMGVIENEIMSLPDGKNFYALQKVSGIDFINYLTAAEK